MKRDKELLISVTKQLSTLLQEEKAMWTTKLDEVVRDLEAEKCRSTKQSPTPASAEK